MFYLYHSIVADTPMASFPSMEDAKEQASKWFAGSGWIVRDVATFDFYKA